MYMSMKPGNPGQRTGSAINWEEGEEHFVTQTGPRIGFREYAAMTVQFAWTGYTELHYTTIKDYGKAARWMVKRAEFLRENQPGLMQDAEIMYGMLMQYFIDEYGQINSRDISALVAQIVKLQELVMTHRPAEGNIDQRDLVTRDSLLDTFAKYKPPSDEDLLADALEMMAEETPA
jgi:hypothetical protein